jgi:hypothetical protein
MGHYWSRMSRHGQWWIADESPGGLGDPEIWVDEAALDMYGRGDSAPVVTVTGGRDYEARDGNWWSGAVIRFGPQPGLASAAVYVIVSRRWSQANGGRPYYVLAWPD